MPVNRYKQAQATAYAKRTGLSAMVCEMDRGNDRHQYTMELDYSQDPEFEAFEGRILLVVHPDGSFD